MLEIWSALSFSGKGSAFIVLNDCDFIYYKKDAIFVLNDNSLI